MTCTFDFIKIRLFPMSSLWALSRVLRVTFDGFQGNLGRSAGEAEVGCCEDSHMHCGWSPWQPSAETGDFYIYNIYTVDIYYTYTYTRMPHTHAYTHAHTLDQHHFQVQEIEGIIISATAGGLRTSKCCCYISTPTPTPVQKAKRYHSNRTT